MENHSKPAPKPVSPHSLGRGELRASMLLPIVIAVGLLILGGIVWLITPEDFNTALAIAISLALLLFLLYWTRHEPGKQRLLAVFFAIPALTGISFGLSNGRLAPIILGVGLTILLLIAYQAISIPISYRFARRQFEAGDLDQALELVDKSIAARPTFWEAYQLKALIFLTQMDFPRAERAAREAIAVNPQVDSAYNTLGQIQLSQAEFEAAKQTYIRAIELKPYFALYWYHLGVCQVRLGEFETAVDSLVVATKRPLHLLQYELWAHYYLWRCLQALGQEEQAAEVHRKMQKFSEGVPLIQNQLATQPATPHLRLLQADLADLEKQLEANSADR